MPEDILTPISQILLKENENLALIFPVTGFKEWDLYFFRVMRRYPLHRTYDEELSEIAADGEVDFNFLGETAIGTGDDILEIWKERPFRMLHLGFGIRPSEVWLFRSIPADTVQTGWGYKIPTKITDKRDYIPGYLSPYDVPTIATETILYYKLTCHIGMHNDADRALRPSLRMLGSGYDTIQITDKTFIDRMLAGVKPCRYVTVGGLAMFTYSVPEEWSPPTRVSASVIAGIMGGAR
jgi:hypothetical protein